MKSTPFISNFRFPTDYLKIFHIFFSPITQIRNICHVLYNHQQQRSHSGIRNMNQLLSGLASPKKSFGYLKKTTTEFIYIIFLFHNFFPFGHPVWMPIFNANVCNRSCRWQVLCIAMQRIAFYTHFTVQQILFPYHQMYLIPDSIFRSLKWFFSENL